MTDTALPGVMPAPPEAPSLDESPPVAPEAPATPDQQPEQSRRRRKALFFLLLGLLGLLLLFGAWYLINRKPITEVLPPVTVDQLPHYSWSVYGVSAPTGVAVNADGSRIYATQTEGDPAVIAFDGSGKPVATMTPPASTSTDHVLVYVAVNPTNGDVYVSDRPAAKVYIYSADGGYRRTFDPGPALKGWQPLGLAFDASGNLFVTSLGAPYQAVHEFGPDGTFVQTFGKPGEFSFPNGVAVDGNGYVYVTDSNNGRMFVFDRSGQRVAIVKRGTAEGQLGIPRGLASDDENRAYTADVTSHGIQIYHGYAQGDSSLKFIGLVGVEGAGDGQFEYPNAVAVDGRGRMYVADWRNNRIQVWSY